MRLRIAIALLLLCLATPVLSQNAMVRTPQRRGWIGGLFGYGFILQVAAVIHWSRKRPEAFWLWIILIGGFIGALAYFLIEGLDFRNIESRMRGPGRRQRIRMLRAMVLDNPSAGNYEELGELFLAEKRFAEARDAYDRALAARTDSIDPFYRRAIALAHLREYDAAARDLERVIAVDPKYDYSNAFCLYARTLSDQGRKPEAMTAFDQLVERSQSAETLYEAAAFFAENDRENDARNLAERILAREQTMPRFQKRRDRIWLRKAKALSRKLRAKSA